MLSASSSPSLSAISNSCSDDVETKAARHLLAAPALASAVNSPETTSSSITSTSLSLPAILAHPHLSDAFEAFLATQHAGESLAFIRKIALLRSLSSSPSASLLRDVTRLIRDYVEEDAPWELNVSARCRSDLIQRVSVLTTFNPAIHFQIFDECEQQVMTMLRAHIPLFNTTMGELVNRVAPLTAPRTTQRRIVVIGGGFAGHTLVRQFAPMHARFHVTLIDTKDYFEYTPAAIRLLAGDSSTYTAARVPHATLLNTVGANHQLVVGRAEQVFADHVLIQGGGANHRVPFDYLAICTGASHTAQLANDTRLTTSYRFKRLKLEQRQLLRAQTVLVIGGGVLGCEIASQIADSYPGKQVILVDANTRLLHRLGLRGSAAHERMLQRLADLGVQVILGERIVSTETSQDGTSTFWCASGRSIICDHVVIATGPWPLSGLVTPRALTSSGHIDVRPSLQLRHHDHIFAAGDVTSVAVEKTAFAACCAATTVAMNICRIERGKSVIAQGDGGTRGGDVTTSGMIVSLGGSQAMLLVMLGAKSRKELGGDDSGNRLAKMSTGETWYRMKDFVERKFLAVSRGEAKLFPAGLYGRSPDPLGAVSTKVLADGDYDGMEFGSASVPVKTGTRY